MIPISLEKSFISSWSSNNFNKTKHISIIKDDSHDKVCTSEGFSFSLKKDNRQESQPKERVLLLPASFSKQTNSKSCEKEASSSQEKCPIESLRWFKESRSLSDPWLHCFHGYVDSAVKRNVEPNHWPRQGKEHWPQSQSCIRCLPRLCRWQTTLRHHWFHWKHWPHQSQD